MPAEVKDAMDFYKRDNNPFGQTRRPAIIDEDGKVAEVGRRKSSSAKVYLIPGNGEVRVNGRSLNIAFGRIHDRESALWALKATERMDKYNVFALVKGGGTTGQAEAVTLGVAKALLAFEPALKPALRRGESRRFLSSIFTLDSLTGALTWVRSWVCDKRPQKSGKEETWEGEGEKDAYLGQAVNDGWVKVWIADFFVYIPA